MRGAPAAPAPRGGATSARPEERPVAASQRPKTTVLTFAEKRRRGEKLTMLTAYDYPGAKLVDEAGVDAILVGDSLAMVVLGHPNTLSVTMDEMLHHAQGASRAGIQNVRLSECGLVVLSCCGDAPLLSQLENRTASLTELVSIDRRPAGDFGEIRS